MVTRRPTEEIARLGDEIYQRDIRREIEADHHGEVVAIDIDSRCWAIGDTVIAARDRLRAERPDANQRAVRACRSPRDRPLRGGVPAERRLIQGTVNAAPRGCAAPDRAG